MPAMPGEFGFIGMENMDDMDGVDKDLEELRDYFRILWEQHVYWTRMAVMGIVHDLPDAQEIQNRLLRNPIDFANALMPFYGEDAADDFEKLLTDHLTIAAELVKAVKAGDNAAADDANKRWHENADMIAAFLASINPYWAEDDWSAMMEEHLNLLAENSTQMIEEKYEDSVNGFDEIEMQALEMADVMADGIAMQFAGF
jgi:leucyl-tRNA synthetase